MTDEPDVEEEPSSIDPFPPEGDGGREQGMGSRRSLRDEPRGTLSEGGMGRVLAVRDPGIGREVARKVIRRRDSASVGAEDELARRFVAEAEVSGRLEHPGIPAVHELGCDERDEPDFTMQFVRGRTLREPMERHREERTSPCIPRMTERAREGTPTPRSARRGLPRELIAICHEALARNPSERYADAGDLSEDLRAFLWTERKKWVQRHRGIALTLFLNLAFLLVAGLLWVFALERAGSAGTGRDAIGSCGVRPVFALPDGEVR